jgi:hypothetical protein
MNVCALILIFKTSLINILSQFVLAASSQGEGTLYEDCKSVNSSE